MYIYTEGDTPALEREAEWMAFQVLAPAYPGHCIAVRAYQGGFYVSDMRFPPGWRMNCPKPSELYSASAYKKKVIMLFGEWLERAGQRRGLLEEGQEIGYVEGIPDKYQVASQKEPISSVVVDTEGYPLRTEPRPQVTGG